jgi:hypothetical protein
MEFQERLCRMADALNTYQYAFDVIMEKGYKIFFIPDPREEFDGDYWAIKDRRDFIASDPLRLLGLISIWEEFGNTWYTQPKRPLQSNAYIMDRALPDTVEDFEQMSQTDFEAFISDYQILFEALGKDYPLHPNMTRQAMFDTLEHFYKWEEEE